MASCPICYGCKTHTCVIAFNLKRKVPFCPCHDCPVKIICVEACHLYDNFFYSSWGFERNKFVAAPNYKNYMVFEEARFDERVNRFYMHTCYEVLVPRPGIARRSMALQHSIDSVKFV